MKQIKVIDYGAGNLHSVLNSVRKVANADENVELCTEAEALRDADAVILPGVGEYQACKAGIETLEGMSDALEEFANRSARPFLGICVGMQLMFDSGEEHGVWTQGFGWLKGDVRKIQPANKNAKIPHMGWNNLEIINPHPVFNGVVTGDDVYFVHSYAARDIAPSELIAHSDYFGAITAASGRDNIIGTQFHPEKSQAKGLQILRNFLDWQP